MLENKGVGNGQNLNQSFDERQRGLDVDDMDDKMDMGQQGMGQDQDMEIQDLGQQDLSQQQGLDDDDMDVDSVGDIDEQGVQPGVDSTLDDDIQHENLESGSSGMNRSIE